MGAQAASEIDRIDGLLPQTQCKRCGYDGCRPYAAAIAAGEADINRCPPGGEATMQRLATHTGRPPRPIDPECGPIKPPLVALIREDECIGCARCIQACPVDAIVGAAKLMHTVIADECTGCELCIPACPVDCIDLPTAAPGIGQVHWPPQTPDDRARADRARRRFEARNQRLKRQRAAKAQRRKRRQATTDIHEQRRAEVADAISRAKAKRAKNATRDW